MRRTSKIFPVFVLLFFSLIATSQILGAKDSDIPRQDRGFTPAYLAPVYNFGIPTGQSQAFLKAKDHISLGLVKSRAEGDQVSSTNYDRQHICTMGRQVEHRSYSQVHFVWTGVDDNQAIYYQAYETGMASNFVYVEPQRVTQASNIGLFASLDVDGDNASIPAANEDINYPSDEWQPLSYWDELGTGIFFADLRLTDTEGGYQNGINLWPKIDWHIGTETVLHMVTTEYGDNASEPITCSYYRRVGGYGSTNGNWEGQRFIDSVTNINVTVASSPASDNVAIVWNAPCDYLGNNDDDDWNHYENDLWYAISTDQGASFINAAAGSIGEHLGQNITIYTPDSEWKAYCDISALISTDDNLHIAWGCRRWNGSSVHRRHSMIFHWSEDQPNIRPVVEAKWDSGGNCYGHPWGSDVGKMSISECDNKLYILYTQFGNKTDPCADTCNANRLINGELYLTTSADYGYWWDLPQNLTNSVTDNCDPGFCESDYWASIARYGRMETCGPLTGQNVLDILYINDVYPGVQTDYANPVMWLRTVCRETADEPLYADDAEWGYGRNYSEEKLLVNKVSDTTIELRIYNPGSLVNNFTIDFIYVDGSDWAEANPQDGSINQFWDDTVNVQLTFSAPPGAGYGEAFECTVQVNNDAFNSPRKIPIGMEISKSNLMIRDCSSDTGDIPDTQCYRRWWKSPDIWIDNNDDGTADAPVYGEINHLYVRGWNIGDTALENSTIRCWYRNPSTGLRFPYEGADLIIDEVNDDSVKTIPEILIDEEERVYFNWLIPDSLKSRHFCLGCLILHERDPQISINPYHENNCGVINSGHLASKKGSTPKGSADSKQPITTWFEQTIWVVNPYGDYCDFIMRVEDLLPDWNIFPDSELGLADMEVHFSLAPEEDTFFVYRIFNDVGNHLDTSPVNFNLYKFPPDTSAGGVHFDLIIDDYPPDSVTGFSVTYNSQIYTITWYEPTQDILGADETIRYFKILIADDPSDLVPPLMSPLDSIKTRLDANSDPGDGYQYEYTEPEGQPYYFTIVPVDLAYNEGTPVSPQSGSPIICGDANSDGAVNVGDAVFLIGYVFQGGDAPNPYCIGDANGDDATNVGDAVYLIGYIFKGGPPPVEDCCN